MQGQKEIEKARALKEEEKGRRKKERKKERAKKRGSEREISINMKVKNKVYITFFLPIPVFGV